MKAFWKNITLKKEKKYQLPFNIKAVGRNIKRGRSIANFETKIKIKQGRIVHRSGLKKKKKYISLKYLYFDGYLRIL